MESHRDTLLFQGVIKIEETYPRRDLNETLRIF